MKRAIFAGIALAAIVMLIAHLEYRFAPVEQAIRETPPYTSLRMCDLTISDGVHYGNMPDPRCYFLKGNK